jgi:hypothetical protein
MIANYPVVALVLMVTNAGYDKGNMQRINMKAALPP